MKTPSRYMLHYKENPIRPTDDVFKDLLVDDGDFDLGLVEELAQRTGRSLQNIEINPYYGKANIVENIVYFLMSNRRHMHPNQHPQSARVARPTP